MLLPGRGRAMIQNRRRFLKTAGLAGATFLGASTRSARAQGAAVPSTYFVETSVLRIGYEASGPADGFPIVLLHGFPDDVRAFDGVVPPLVRAGYRALVPYLRGYGPTRFRDAAAPRMAEQAAIGQDVIDFADALRLALGLDHYDPARTPSAPGTANLRVLRHSG